MTERSIVSTRAPTERRYLEHAGAWWEALPLDFSRERERFVLGRRDTLRVKTTAFADVVLRTIGASLLGALAFPTGYTPSRIDRAFEDFDLYARLAHDRDPERFFTRPPKGIQVNRKLARRPLFWPPDGTCEDLSFASPYVPRSPHAKGPYLAVENNRTAHARYWRVGSSARPTIIAVHGFSADFYHLNEWFFDLPALYAKGYDVLLFTLPFHGRRQGRFSPFSGYGFFAGGISRINEAFGQAITDLRVLLDWLLRERGITEVGIMGISLGGLTTSLLASVEDRIKFAIPNVPVVSLADLVLEWSPIAELMKASLAVRDTSLYDVREMLAVTNPLTYQPAIPKDRRMIIGGIADRLAPPKHAQLLWEHWERCRIHWFPGSHLIHLDRAAYLAQIVKFLDDIGFSVTPR